MSYIGRQLPNTMDDKTLIETDDKYLTRSYSLSKNFASRANTNGLTLDNTPTLLHTSGSNLFTTDIGNLCPSNPLDSYFARNQSTNFPTYYECKKGFLQGAKLIIIGSILYQLQDVSLIKVLALPLSLMTTDIDEFEVIHESDELLFIKVTSLIKSRNLINTAHTNSTPNTNIRDIVPISTFVTFNKKDISYSEYGIVGSTYNYNIYTKIFEDDSRVIYYPLLKCRTPYDTFTGKSYSAFTENPSGSIYRLIVINKITSTISALATGNVVMVDSTPYTISTPEVIDNQVRFYQSGLNEIYSVILDLQSNALSHIPVAITDAPYALGSVKLETYEFANYCTVDSTPTVTTYRFKLNTSILVSYKVQVGSKFYLLRAHLPINARAWAAHSCLNNRGDVVLIAYEIQSDGSLKYVKDVVLPDYISGMIPLGGTKFLLCHKTYSILDVKDLSFVISSIQIPNFTIGSVSSSGDILTYQDPLLTRISTISEGINVAVVNSKLDSTIKSYYSVAVSSSELETITLRVTNSTTSQILPNTDISVDTINAVFDDGAITKTLTTDSNGFVTFWISKNLQGQVGIRVRSTSDTSVPLPSYNSSIPIRRVPLYGSIKNWGRMLLTSASGTRTYQFTPQEMTVLGSPDLRIYIQGAGGAYGSAGLSSYQMRFWNGRNYNFETRYAWADGGCGGSGAIILDRKILVGSKINIVVNITSTTLSDENSTTLSSANNGSAGGSAVTSGVSASGTIQGSGSASPGIPGNGGSGGSGLVTIVGTRGVTGRSATNVGSYPTRNISPIPSLSLSRLGQSLGGTDEPALVDVSYDLLPFINMSLTPPNAVIVSQRDLNGFTKSPGAMTMGTSVRGALQLLSTNFTQYCRFPSFAFTASEDFTIEFWMNPIMARLGSAGSTLIAPDIANSWRVLVTPEKTLKFTVTSGATVQTVVNPTVLTDTPQHICIERVNGLVTIYVNGVGSTPTTIDLEGVAVAYHEFKSRSATDCLAGEFWNFRLTRASIYKGNFTPPIANYQY